jgi:hypothetical protein
MFGEGEVEQINGGMPFSHLSAPDSTNESMDPRPIFLHHPPPLKQPPANTRVVHLNDAPYSFASTRTSALALLLLPRLVLLLAPLLGLLLKVLLVPFPPKVRITTLQGTQTIKRAATFQRLA